MKGNLYLPMMMQICGIVIKAWELPGYADMLGGFLFFIVVFNTLYWCGVGI